MSSERVPFVDSVFHPSDFSPGSESAFAHALAIAVARKTRFTIFHVESGDPEKDVRTEFPAVRGTLQRWGVLEPGSPRSAVFEELGIAVKKVFVRKRRVLAGLTDYLNEHPTDLIVLATEGREGLPGWLVPSIAERVARRARTNTLFVPKGSGGIVSPDDGSLSLRRILVPVDREPDPWAALVYATQAAELAPDGQVEILLLHVGDSDAPSSMELPESSLCSWVRLHRRGDVVDEIVGAAAEHQADLIFMTTRGHDDFLDALRGSITEQVLRRSPCPLLAVPQE